MGIVTKKGDAGMTSLWSGERVGKDSLRVEAYGNVDELGAFLSDALHLDLSEPVRGVLVEIQRDLFRVCSSLASTGKPVAEPVTDADASRLEAYIAAMEKDIHLKGFVIPGQIPESARLDICRTLARRAERGAVALSRAEPVEPSVLAYLNRLSDYLFAAARYEEWRRGKILYM